MTPEKTDWDKYYAQAHYTARLTRRITGRVIASLLEKYISRQAPIEIAELGGANSCVYAVLNKRFTVSRYYLIDNNQAGLDKVCAQEPQARQNIVAFHDDILSLRNTLSVDCAYSVGVIEHFNERDTAQAIRAHFAATKDGGIVLISFPTPTVLYRVTRKVLEMFGLWAFYDERPLRLDEVLRTVRESGEVLEQSVIWRILLTQAVVVARKKAEGIHP